MAAAAGLRFGLSKLPPELARLPNRPIGPSPVGGGSKPKVSRDQAPLMSIGAAAFSTLMTGAAEPRRALNPTVVTAEILSAMRASRSLPFVIYKPITDADPNSLSQAPSNRTRNRRRPATLAPS